MRKRIGKVIEEHLGKRKDLNVVDFAKALKVSRNTVYDIFSRNTIQTEMLEKIGQILEYDFFQDFLSPETKKKIAMEERVSKKIYVEIDLSDEEAQYLDVANKLINVCTNKIS